MIFVYSETYGIWTTLRVKLQGDELSDYCSGVSKGAKVRMNICIYCGEEGTSKEHVWPRWIRKHAATVMKVDPANFQAYVASWEREGSEPRHVLRKKGNSRLSLTIQHPCEDCNNGWLHDLEDAAIPIVKPMIEGKKTLLSEAEVRILRAWATKTALHFLYDGQETWSHPIPPHLATQLYQGRHNYSPVQDVQVWSAIYSPLRLFLYRHMSALGYGVHPETGEKHVVLRSVFIAGHMMIYVRLPDAPIAQGLGWRDPLPQFVPLHEPASTLKVSWRNGSVDDDGVSETFSRHINLQIHPSQDLGHWVPLT